MTLSYNELKELLPYGTHFSVAIDENLCVVAHPTLEKPLLKCDVTDSLLLQNAEFFQELKDGLCCPSETLQTFLNILFVCVPSYVTAETFEDYLSFMF